MKTAPLMVLGLSMSFAAVAQTLPDEINYAPYETRYRNFDTETTNTESELSASESDLVETRKFIVDMTNHIAGLETGIRNGEAEIARLRQEIPRLESELSSLNSQASQTLSEIRNRESQETRIANSHRDESNRLRPMEEVVARKLQRIRELESNLNEARRQAREAEAKINRAQNELQQAERTVENERSEQREMKVELAGIQGQINSIQSEISRLESEVPRTESQLNQEKNRLQTFQRQVQEAQNELNQIRSQGPSQSQLSEAERKLSAATSNRDRSASQLNTLENQLNRSESEIDRLEALISSTQSEISTEKQKLSALENRVDEYTAELSRLRSSGATPEQIKDIERKLNGATNARQKTIEGIAKLEAQIPSSRSQISQLNASQSGIRSQISSEKQKLSGLEREVDEARRALTALQNSGPAPERVREAERKLAAAQAEKERCQNSIASLDSDLKELQSSIRTKRANLEERRRQANSLPTRIAQSEARERDATNLRSTLNQNLQRLQSDLTQADRSVQSIEGSIVIARNDMRNDETNLERQRNIVANLAQDLNAVRSDLNNLEAKHKALVQEANETITQIAEDKKGIPEIQADIKTSQNEIAKGRKEIETARGDERTLIAAISKIESRLSTLRSDRDNAENQMNQRQSLYQKYLSEAKSLGSSQSTNAASLGEKEGQLIAKNISKQQGEAVGAELGSAEAKLWGSIRGELSGYEQGYAQGLASVDDINLGIKEGKAKGKSDALLHAETQFRPAYFEEALQVEFKKPLGDEGLKLMIFDELQPKMLLRSMAIVPPLSPEEIKNSDNLKTPLDSSILALKNDVKVLEGKVISLSKPDVVYVAPAQISHGVPKCTEVYKNLGVFRKACEDSYKESFGGAFLQAARSSFGAQYPEQFKSVFAKANANTREAQFSTEEAKAKVVSSAFGLKLGKQDIYQQKFTAAYKEVYDLELPPAKEKAKLEAIADLNALLSTKSLLTLNKAKISAENFRGGEAVSFLSQIKNISKVVHNGPVLLKITEVKNVEFSTSELLINQAQPLSITKFQELKGKIALTGKTGDQIVIKGNVILPGDIYKPQRQETFEITQVLTANPNHDLKLDYSKNPDIKSVFKRKVHTLKVSMKPLVEDLASGYQLSLKAIGPNASQVDQSNKEIATGLIRQNELKEFKFNYQFKNDAKNKTIQMELIISFEGKVLKKEIIEVVPK